MGQKETGYILLEFFKKTDTVSVRNNERTWYIMYNNDEECFLCENLSNGKVVNVLDVEALIRVWLDNANFCINDTQEEARICFFIGGKYYAGFACDQFGKDTYYRSMDMVNEYISVLKNLY
ncbi:hypothetical protein BD770DRAFT_408084 [Pilaira anomala]|nr:hypothetical protein BD770DRAFT_408084 [Pilaira anomala]